METIIPACIASLATIVSGLFAARISRDKTPYNVLDVIEKIPEGCKGKKRLTNWLISDELWKFSDGAMYSTAKFFLLLLLFSTVIPFLFWLVVGVVSSINEQSLSLTQFIEAGEGYIYLFLSFLVVDFIGLMWLESKKRRDVRKVMTDVGMKDDQTCHESSPQPSLQKARNRNDRAIVIVSLALSFSVSAIALIAFFWLIENVTATLKG